MEEASSSSSDLFELKITATAITYLKESAKWSKFLAIMGFIGIALMVVAALFTYISYVSMGNEMARLMPYPPIIIPIVYIIMAGIYFMPIYYLYNYASKTLHAFTSDDSVALTEAFENLKSHHKFLGIATILVLSIYVLMLIGVVVFFASNATTAF